MAQTNLPPDYLKCVKIKFASYKSFPRLAVTLLVTTTVTIILQIISSNNNTKNVLDTQLLEIQRLSMVD